MANPRGAGEEAAPALAPHLLALFVILHVINHIDRHLVASLGPQIMADLGLGRAAFGVIAGLAFSLVYAVAALGAGVLADRFGRVPVLTGGVGVWSIFTAASGAATGFWSLLALRPLVAAGEATLVPTATNIILARTPERARATTVGIFFMGLPLGVGGAYLVAAMLGPRIGWRACFFVMGVLGLCAMLAVARVRDVRPTPDQQAHAPSLAQRLARWGGLMRANPRLCAATVAVVLLHAHMATGAFTQLWLTAEKGFSAPQAASLYGVMFIVFGALGAAGGGALADALHRHRGVDRAHALGALLLALAPLIAAYRLAPGDSIWTLVGMAASAFFFTAVYGPCFAIIERETPPELKATATGMNMLLINVVMIGALAALIGLASEALAARGVARSWTWPLLGADALALLGAPLLLMCKPSRAG